MARKNPHIGSSFESWLEEGASLKAVAAFNLPVARVVVDTSGKAGDSTPATTH